jgi:hypothetical protein
MTCLIVTEYPSSQDRENDKSGSSIGFAESPRELTIVINTLRHFLSMEQIQKRIGFKPYDGGTVLATITDASKWLEDHRQ